MRRSYAEDVDELELLESREDETTPYPELDSFLADGLISEVLYEVKSGKEATVYCCRGTELSGAELLAAKIYRPRTQRNFKNAAVYQEGRVHGDRHLRRAIANKSRIGREAEFGMWVYQEWETLRLLHAAGVDVPRPVAQADKALLIEYLGDGEDAAPKLGGVTLEPHEVRPLFERTLYNIELSLAHNRIHGDLSPFNILYWEGRLIIIDMPQAVDPRINPNALPLLERDLANVCNYWARYGVLSDPIRIARHMWGRYLRAEL
jgi:RIO kinase 1